MYSCIKYIEDITRLREDMDFMFEWQEQHIVLAISLSYRVMFFYYMDILNVVDKVGRY